MGYKQGLFKPKQPSKYKGNIHKIKFRSSWEYDMMVMLDSSPLVKAWSSETIIVKYYDSVLRKNRNYYTDFYVEWNNGTKKILEIKPHTKLIKPSPNVTPRVLHEHINIFDKANATVAYCRVLQRRGIDVKFAFVSKINGKYQMIEYDGTNPTK